MPTYLLLAVLTVGVVAIPYLLRVNHLLKGVPGEIQSLVGPPWTAEQVQKIYKELDEDPVDYATKLPPKLERRYVVTGGNGLVGGFIVLQLLARGTPPECIRIIDVRRPERNDMKTGQVTEVEYIQTDIRSANAVLCAFEKPWATSAAHLPLTVFHTAAVILASDRSKYLYGFPYAVNVEGTENMIAAAKAAGANIFSSTSSASISIRPVRPWVPIWASAPGNFWQILDERDFAQPLRSDDEFFGNYPRSKATAERLVCEANTNGFRTGCIRPANGVYGNPTDNAVGVPLSKSVFPTWAPHVVQSFVHGANVAVGHLHHEAVLLSSDAVENIPQAGRPFVVTDPNPPIPYSDLYTAISTLSVHPFRVLVLPPVFILVLSHLIEWYSGLPHRLPSLRKVLPPITGDARHLQPGLFSICTHLVASGAEARKSISQGGLGYEGLMTTMQGMVLEILEWNREHAADDEAVDEHTNVKRKKSYTTSITWADQLRQAVDVGGTGASAAT